MKKVISFLILVIMLFALPTSCANKNTSLLNNKEEITLTIAGPWPECKAIETAAVMFSEKNPSCHIIYEYIQNYDENLPKRLSSNTDKIDLMLVNNIQEGSVLLPYTLELSSQSDKLDLSHTFEGLVNNYRLQTENISDQGKIYAIPLGAEVRGMFVNVTLLKSLDLKIPTNRKEFLNACETLLNAGYIPIHGNPGMCPTQFLYPYICNTIAHANDYESTYEAIDKREEDIYTIFQEPLELLYSIVEKGYYNYKYVENELGLFKDITNEGYARDFLNITADANGNYKKTDDLGRVAFMPFTQSINAIIDKMKDDYHSNIEYEFILSPVGENGGYAYMSPGRGIAINNGTDNIDWSLNFMNFLFEEDNNILFCEDMGHIPNTRNALQLITDTYDIPETNICHLGQVTFHFDFYGVINDTLIEISKANNPKYMSTDNNGTPVMYPFSYYMNNLKERFCNK